MRHVKKWDWTTRTLISSGGTVAGPPGFENVLQFLTPDYASRKRNLAHDRAFVGIVMQQCPNCWEPMSLVAKVCPHCGHGESVAAPPSKRQLGSIFWLSLLLMLAFAALLTRFLGIL